MTLETRIAALAEAIGADVKALTTLASQAEMEAGTEAELRAMSPLRVAQAIAALAGKDGGGFTQARYFPSSTTFTPPRTGMYGVIVCGGGGSGAAATAAAAPVGATGGGAGGIALKVLALSAAVTYTVTIGSGGAMVTANNARVNGNAGGSSSFAGADIATISASGGAGGTATQLSTQVNGASGGIGSGGDINLQGGGSGYVTGIGAKATGGGAINITGTAYSSGYAQCASASYSCASGGAGVGGKSGDVYASTAWAMSSGGGAGGASSNATNSVNPYPGVGADIMFMFGLILNGKGGVANINDTTADPGPGAGSGAYGLTSGAGRGGGFGGGGGATIQTNTYNPGGRGAGGSGSSRTGTRLGSTLAACLRSPRASRSELCCLTMFNEWL